MIVVYKEIDVLSLFTIILQNRKRILYWALGGILLGIIVAFSIPREYTTEVTIAPEGQANVNAMGSMGALADMVGISLNDADKDGIGEKFYPTILKSTPFLLEFSAIQVNYKGKEMSMREYLLDYQKKTWWQSVIEFPGKLIGYGVRLIKGKPSEDSLFALHVQNRFVKTLKQRVDVLENKKDGSFSFTAVMQDPVISMQIADSLLVKLQRYMTVYRTHKIRIDLESNQKMLAEAQQKYYKLDREYAEAQDRNQKLVSRSAHVYLDRLENEKNLAFLIYQQIAIQVETNRVKLQEITPIATVIEPARMPLLPSSPRKTVIIIVFTFLSVFVCMAKMIVMTIFKPEESPISSGSDKELA